MFELKGKTVFVAGHRGMVGSAIIRRLQAEECRIVVAGRDTVDLRNQTATHAFIMETQPQAVFLAAARVGGIHANDTRPGEFLYDNLMIEANVVEASRRADVEKLLFLGSSCIYPKFAAQPIAEGALLTGPLEPTNEWYAVAKIAGIKLVQAYRRQYGCNFISAMPTNLYGPGDNYDLQTSHVLPALIRKAHEAKVAGELGMEIWGTGKPMREFLHVDDLADACIFLMKEYSGELPINVGYGADISIGELATMVMDIVGLEGDLRRNTDLPDGTPRKLLDSGKLRAMGWAPQIALKEGLAQTYADFLDTPGLRRVDRSGALGHPVEQTPSVSVTHGPL